jgi:POT family
VFAWWFHSSHLPWQGVTIPTIPTAAPGLEPPPYTNPTSGCCVKASAGQLAVLYLALYLTALGTVGLKSSVPGFDSDQFDDTDKTEKKQMVRFFLAGSVFFVLIIYNSFFFLLSRLIVISYFQKKLEL